MLLFEGNCEKYYKFFQALFWLMFYCFFKTKICCYVVACDLVSLFPFCLGDEVKKNAWSQVSYVVDNIIEAKHSKS